MIGKLQVAATLLAVLGCGLIAGVFFAFSTFVMKALARLPAPQGIAAMQTINVVVLNPWFLGAFFGTGLLCFVAAVLGALDWDQPGIAWRLAGCLSYILGTIMVTIGGNVPLNNTLAAVEPESADAYRFWPRYVARWTAWNHVRAAAATLAAGFFAVALI